MKTNKEMIEEVTDRVMQHDRKVKSKRKVTVSLFAVLTVFICLAVAAGASGIANRWAVFSPEWRDNLIDRAQNAGTADGVENFKERRAQSDDILAKDENYFILPDRENEVFINVTQTGGDYIFTLESIIPAEQLRNRLVSGSLARGDMVFEWQVNVEYYALVRISRTDGQPMRDEEGGDPFFHFHRYIEGYSPFAVNMCLEGDGAFTVMDGDTMIYAVNVTQLVAFADRTLVLCPVDIDGDYDCTEHLYAAKDEPITRKDTAPATAVLLTFDLPDSMADKNAQQELLNGREEMFNNFNYGK